MSKFFEKFMLSLGYVKPEPIVYLDSLGLVDSIVNPIKEKIDQINLAEYQIHSEIDVIGEQIDLLEDQIADLKDRICVNRESLVALDKTREGLKKLI